MCVLAAYVPWNWQTLSQGTINSRLAQLVHMWAIAYDCLRLAAALLFLLSLCCCNTTLLVVFDFCRRQTRDETQHRRLCTCKVFVLWMKPSFNHGGGRSTFSDDDLLATGWCFQDPDGASVFWPWILWQRVRNQGPVGEAVLSPVRTGATVVANQDSQRALVGTAWMLCC